MEEGSVCHRTRGRNRLAKTARVVQESGERRFLVDKG